MTVLLVFWVSDSLLAGILQEVTVKLHAGSSVIEAGSKVMVVPSSGLQVDNKMTDSGTSLGDTVMIEQAQRGATVEWKMTLLQGTKTTGGDKVENKVTSGSPRVACMIRIYFFLKCSFQILFS